MLNDSGQPMQVVVWGGQHLTVRQYLDLFSMTGNMVPLKCCAAVMELVYAYYTPQRVAALENQREIGNVLIACADVYAAYGDLKAALLASLLVDHCYVAMGFEAGVHWVTINTAEQGKPDGNHGGCGINTEQTSRIGWGLVLWSRLAPLTTKADAVLLQVYACLTYAASKAGPDELAVVDYDIGKEHHEPHNAFLRFALPVMVEAGGTLRDRALAFWKGQDFSKVTDKNFDTQHNLSVNLYLLKASQP